MMKHTWIAVGIFFSAALLPANAADGNRLAYLDGSDPYYVSLNFPKLITPQWVGEPGVDAVVVLAIDDMRGHERWEQFLRPVLNRLKRIDGRAPVSIMTCKIDANDSHLQQWLREGLSLEVHTVDHPCPLLKDGDFARAKSTYDRCLDMMASVPHNQPVAFRMPCCDSLNTLSPRFFAEIFNKKTARGNFLQADSSVFSLLTPDDPALPRDLILDADGREKFHKYVPDPLTFMNTIENYPYPFVINRLCWEFPCLTPSDWEGQHRFKPASPELLRDWKAGLDATVIKKGTLTLVFHPYGWSAPQQLVELVDYAERRYGKRVKFLTFKEAVDRLTKNVLGGQPLRAANGEDNGVRLLDVNNDGYIDVVIGNEHVRQTRIWSPATQSWSVTDFPMPLISVDRTGHRADAGVRFGVTDRNGYASFLFRNLFGGLAFQWNGVRWIERIDLLRDASVGTFQPLSADGEPVLTAVGTRDQGARLRDLDRTGICELIVSNPKQNAVFRLAPNGRGWTRLPFALPAGTSMVNADGKDNGLRLVDVNQDGRLDVLFSNEEHYSLDLFTSMKSGWSRHVVSGPPGDVNALPMISRHGANNGAAFHDGQLWVQNEDTSGLPNLVAVRSFKEMLAGTDSTAKTPEESLHCLRPRPGFKAELVASEPLVTDCIAYAWGPDGKLWVAEMGDYPLGTDGHGKAGGRIKYLESTHHDGHYDKVTLFMDGLHYPTGVAPWRNGVLVTCAPEIFYAEATRKGGKADKKVVLYTGFIEGNPQHRVNSLVWGLDNWIHCANGDSGGLIRSVKTGKQVDIHGRDFRIRPDTGDIEAEAGETQYGRSRDDWGNWFGNNNSYPAWHVVLDDHYLRRNPHVAAPNPLVQVSITPGPSRVYPISRLQQRFNDPQAANHFTSANSCIVYRDDLFGPLFAANTFVSEPVHNLVHREIMTPQGVTFTSRRAADEQHSEFLASTDNWTRPCMIQTGPDGALWMADMYRYVIEHPEWIPIEWQRRLDLRAGAKMGRIYRIYPDDKKPRAIPRLDQLDTAGLVAALDSANGWQRDMAQQMLLWRADPSAVPPLETLAMEGRRPVARLHALCTLDGLHAITPKILLHALADSHPGVRRHAIRLCEGHFKQAPELGERLLALIDDTDPHVRMQLAYTLGEWNDARAGRVIGQLMKRAAGDPYLTAAAMSSVNRSNLAAVVTGAIATGPDSAPPASLFEKLLVLADAFGDQHAMAGLLNDLARPSEGVTWKLQALRSLLDGLESKNSSLAKLAASGGVELQTAVERTDRLFKVARRFVTDPKADHALRLATIYLLGRGPSHQAEDVKILLGLLTPQMPDDIQGAAVATLGRLHDPSVPTGLLRGWKGFGPGIRSQVLAVLFSRPAWLHTLLDAVEAKAVPAYEVDAARRQALLVNKDARVRERAARIFAGALNKDRQKVIDSYRLVLGLKGDPGHGLQVFTKNCSTCHRLGTVGNEVGPNLGTVTDKSSEYLVTNILDPNRSVEPRFISYLAELKDGRLLTGVLTSETGPSVTLVSQDGKQHPILRTDLESLTSTGKSLMPEGLEKDVKPQDMADLIAFIRSSGPNLKPKVFAGNKPELIHSAGDGSLVLRSTDCEIYGSSLVLEKQYGNLGYWSSADDQAVWTVDVARPGEYEVWFNYACPAGVDVNRYVLQAGDHQLVGKVMGHGTWDDYQIRKVGLIQLSAGTGQITLKPVGQPRGALLDLKSIRLVPAGPAKGDSKTSGGGGIETRPLPGASPAAAGL